MTDQEKTELFSNIKRFSNKVPKELLLDATILHDEWELDNHGWIVRMEDDSIMAFTTNHGGIREWKKDSLIAKIKETSDSLKQLQSAFNWFTLMGVTEKSNEQK